MHITPRRFTWTLGLLFSLATVGSSLAQSYTASGVVKLWDFSNFAGSAFSPQDSPAIIGNELWFTTLGGSTGFGTLSRFNYVNPALNIVQDIGTTAGNSPNAAVTLVNNDRYVYYTTSRGGSGDRGTISVYDRSTSTNKVLFASPALTSNPVTTNHSFPGNVTYIDKGEVDAQNDGIGYIYAMYGGGNVAGGIGGIVKLTLNTRTQTVTSSTQIHSFQGGATHLSQPQEGFTRVGDKLYFGTFVGGPTSAGGIGFVDLINDSVTDNFSFFTGAPFSLGSSNPAYDPITGFLYYATTGNNTNPGALLRIDPATGAQSAIYSFSPRSGSTSPNADGAQPYGGLTIIGSTIFLSLSDGGANDRGAIGMYDLLTGQYTKIADLAGTGDTLGGQPFGGFAVKQDGTGYDLFLLTKTGGTSNVGTILRVDVSPVPEPTTGLLLAGGALSAGFFRRRRRLVA